MGVIDLSADKPVPGTSGDANQIANGFTLLETLLNGNIDRQNIANGIIGARTSTTVAGLGTLYNGDVVFIRGGSTPYDFGHLVYDSTYGKLVSPPIVVCESAQSGDGTTTSATYQNLTILSNSTHVRLPWKTLNTAGLKWQFKWDASVGIPVGQTAFGIRLTAYAADYESNQAQDTTNIFGEVTTFSVSTTKIRTSGWVDLNTSITVTDSLMVMPQIKSDGTRTVTLKAPGQFSVLARLVA